MDPDHPAPFHVKRKPVVGSRAPAPAPRRPTGLAAMGDGVDEGVVAIGEQLDAIDIQDASRSVRADPPPEYQEYEEDALVPPPLPPRQPSMQSLRSVPSAEFFEFSSSATQVPAVTTSSNQPFTASTTGNKSLFQSAANFATSLLPTPTTSTKYFTILRHSPPLVLYRGPSSTAITLTLFSHPSHPLPPDRTLWLQQRGYSGTTGMRVKTLLGGAATASWIDVTPAVRAALDDVPEGRRDRWDRDIRTAEKKLAREMKVPHVTRETVVCRIPVRAGDGYFRVVLCTGGGSGDDSRGGSKTTKRKVLCTSPVFRLASTSTDSSVFRGAGIRNMPLEVGVKVASVMGMATVDRYVGPVRLAVQTQVQRVQPGWAAQTAGQMIFARSGLEGKVESAGERYDVVRQADYQTVAGSPSAGAREGEEEIALVVGPDEGPEKPFPLKFYGKVVQGTGRSGRDIGVPTANLSEIPEDVKAHLRGVYFGWACLMPGSVKTGSGISLDWHEAIITAAPATDARAVLVPPTKISVYMLHHFDGATFVGAKMKVITMGFLRPLNSGEMPLESTLAQLSQDAAVTVASLGRENWGPETTINRMKTVKSARTMTDRYIDVRNKVQKQVDRMPVHLAGVRTQGHELQDQNLGNGGYYIPR